MNQHRNDITSFFARAMAFALACLMVFTGLPEGLYNWIAEGQIFLANTRAEASEVRDGQEGNWLYAVTEAGTLTLYGYADPEIESLTLPERLGEGWVTGVGADAFAENTHLCKITVPGSISRIDGKAFAGCTALTVVGWNGTRAMTFARERGFSFVNLSSYDFYDDILDLSGWAEGSWGFSENQLRVEAPYSTQMTEGQRLFVPACGQYSKGMPLSVTGIQRGGSGALLTCAEVSFVDAIERMVLENETCYVDVGGISTAEGVTLTGVETAAPRLRGTSTTQIDIAALSFDYKFPLGVGTEISGSVKLTPSATLSFDFSWFTLNSIELNMKEKFEVEAKATYGMKGKDGTWNIYHDDNKKNPALDRRLARIPLYSAGLVTLNLDVNIVVDCYGEVSLKVAYEKNTKVTWKNGDEHPVTTVTKKFTDPTISAAFTISLQIKGALKITIGFGDLSINVLELSAAIGPKFTATTCNAGMLESPCIDMYVRLLITVQVRVGLLDEKEKGGGTFSGKLEFGFKKEWEFEMWHKHFWLSDWAFHDECGKGQGDSLIKTYTLEFHAGNGYPPETQTIMEGMKAEKPWNPTRKGYTFQGWYIQDTDTSFDFNTEIHQDYVLVARWINNDTGEEETAPVVTLPPATVTPTPTGGGGNTPTPLPSDLTPEEQASLGYMVYTPYSEQYGTGPDVINPTYTLITQITGNPTTLHIPSMLDGRPVAVAGDAFEDCSNLTYLQIGNVYLLSTDFEQCSSLRTVVFSTSYDSNGQGLAAYGSCYFDGLANLTSVFLPQVDTYIPQYGFVHEPVFPSFRGCTGLQGILIPGIYRRIPDKAFMNCTALRSISASGQIRVGNQSFKNCTALAQLPFDCFIWVGSNAFENCTALETVDWKVPNGGGGTGENAFKGCTSLNTVRISGSIRTDPTLSSGTSIYTGSFSGCTSLTSVSLSSPEDVGIGGNAFTGCENLSEIRVNAPQLRASRFLDTGSETKLVLPETCSISVSQDGALKGVQIVGNKQLTVEGMVKSEAFRDTKGLDQVTLANGFPQSASNVFRNSDLRSLSLQAGNYGSTTYFCADCPRLESVVFTGTAGSIQLGKNMFQRCPLLREATLPDGLKIIRESVFHDCSSLTSVYLPNSLTTIDGMAFYGCTSLQTIELPDSLTTINHSAFYKCSALESIRLPAGINAISNATFGYCTSLKQVFLPAGITSIGVSAFASCASLKDITLPETLNSLKSSAFARCTNLMNVKIEAALTDIPGGCFSDCTSLTTILLPDSVETIGQMAFSGCSNLNYVNIPSAVTKISSNAFSNCSSLIEITVPAENVMIQMYAFSNCTALREVHLHAGVQLGYRVFDGCENLETLALKTAFTPVDGQTLTSVFRGCGNLQVVYLPVAEEQGELAEYIRATWPDAVFLPYDAYGTALLRAIFDDGHGGIQTNVTAVGALLPPPQEPEAEEYVLEGWELDHPGGDNEVWDFAARRVRQEDIHAQLDNYSNCVMLNAVWRYAPAGFVWDEENDCAIITEYKGKQTDLVLPDVLGDLPVTGIAAGAFGPGVEQITLNAGLEDIADGAFMYATDLSWINVEDCDAFQVVDDALLYNEDGTRLLFCFRHETEPELSEDTEEIASYAFYDSDCEKLFLPDGVESVGDYAFAFSKELEELSVAGAVCLGTNATTGCSSLAEVIFEQDVVSIGAGNFQEDITFVFGPTDAENLTAYADENRISYNRYLLTFWQEDTLLATYYVRAGQPVPKPVLPEEMEKALFGWHDRSAEEGQELWDFMTGIMPRAELELETVWGYPYTWEETENGIRLTAYTGLSDTPCIPDNIDELPVTDISENCFEGRTLLGIRGEKGSIAETFAMANNLPFTALTHTVTFDSGVGSRVPARTVTAAVLLEEPQAVATGYRLEGWYEVTDDELAEEPWDFAQDTTPRSDLTLKAIWTQVADAPRNLYEVELVTGGISILGYTGSSHRISIPAEINGQPVVAVSPYAFWGDEQLYSVTLPASLRSVGEGAFAESRLERVVFREGCETIGDSAFAGCGELSGISLPASLIHLGAYAFMDCVSLSSVSLPESLTELREGCFSGCLMLSGMTIPDRVTSVESNVFAGCSRLTSLTLGSGLQTWTGDAVSGCIRLVSLNVKTGNDTFMARNQVLYSADETQLYLYPAGLAAETFTVPEGVAYIWFDAFAGSRVNTVSLPASLLGIGAGAFRDAKKLREILLPENSVLSELGPRAFAGCQRLAEFTVPSGVYLLQTGTFDGCYALTKLVIPEGTEVAAGAIPKLSGLTVYGLANTSAQMRAREAGVRFVNLAASGSALTAITLNITELDLCPGQSQTLEAALTPENTTETNLTWFSDNPEIATVSDGIVKGRYTGTTTVWAEGAGGIRAGCAVRVVNFRPEDYTLRFERGRITLTSLGERQLLVPVLSPSSPMMPPLTWSVADSGVVSCAGGWITALRKGSTTVTASMPGGLNATCTVIVRDPFEVFRLNLPVQLAIVEANAFEGILAEEVVCPPTLKRIESRAFANCTQLERIIIPGNLLEYIAPDAFEDSTLVSIVAPAEGKAKDYADEKHIPFIPQ